MGAYKVFKVKDKDGVDGWEIFWCPSAPVHFDDRKVYDGKVYPQRAGAYRRVKQLNNELEQMGKEEKQLEESVA